MPDRRIDYVQRLPIQGRDLVEACDQRFFRESSSHHALRKLDDPHVRLDRRHAAANLQPVKDCNAQAFHFSCPFNCCGIGKRSSSGRPLRRDYIAWAAFGATPAAVPVIGVRPSGSGRRLELSCGALLQDKPQEVSPCSDVPGLSRAG